MHASGIGGSGFLVTDLGGGEVGFKIGPRFFCCFFLIPFFNGVCKDAGVAEDGFADADKLWVGFRGAMSFRQCCIFMYLAENVCDRLFMDVLMLK